MGDTIFKSDEIRQMLLDGGIAKRTLEEFSLSSGVREERDHFKSLKADDCDFWIELDSDEELIKDGESYEGTPYSIHVEFTDRYSKRVSQSIDVYIDAEQNEKYGFGLQGRPLENRQLEVIRSILSL